MTRLVGESGTHPGGEVVSIARPVAQPHELSVRLPSVGAPLELLRVRVVDAGGLVVAALSIEGGCGELVVDVELTQDTLVETRVGRVDERGGFGRIVRPRAAG